MEERVKGVVVALLVVVGTLFSLLFCYGLIYIWIRESIDYYIDGIKPSITSSGDDDKSSLPRSRRFGNWFLVPLTLSFPLATWLCIARLMEFNSIMFALSWWVSLSVINYYYLSNLYFKFGKWLTSRGYKYNSPNSQEAVKYIIAILIIIGGFGVQCVEGHAIIGALTITAMSVIAYIWKKDRSGITKGIELGYWYLLVFRTADIGKDIWYREREARILLFPLIFSWIAMLTEEEPDHYQGKVANMQQSYDASSIV